jgi:predicted metal-binding protein
MFGCPEYGKCGSCPPAVPSVDECHKMIREYKSALILHFSVQSQTKDEKHRMMTNLLALEREIFLAGYYKVFLLPHHSCNFCENCVAGVNRIKCVDKSKSRPSPDAMGIDIFQTARGAGYSLEVATTKDSVTNRFSFVLID